MRKIFQIKIFLLLFSILFQSFSHSNIPEKNIDLSDLLGMRDFRNSFNEECIGLYFSQKKADELRQYLDLNEIANAKSVLFFIGKKCAKEIIDIANQFNIPILNSFHEDYEIVFIRDEFAELLLKRLYETGINAEFNIESDFNILSSISFCENSKIIISELMKSKPQIPIEFIVTNLDFNSLKDDFLFIATKTFFENDEMRKRGAMFIITEKSTKNLFASHSNIFFDGIAEDDSLILIYGPLIKNFYIDCDPSLHYRRYSANSYILLWGNVASHINSIIKSNFFPSNVSFKERLYPALQSDIVLLGEAALQIINEADCKDLEKILIPRENFLLVEKDFYDVLDKSSLMKELDICFLKLPNDLILKIDLDKDTRFLDLFAKNDKNQIIVKPSKLDWFKKKSLGYFLYIPKYLISKILDAKNIVGAGLPRAYNLIEQLADWKI